MKLLPAMLALTVLWPSPSLADDLVIDAKPAISAQEKVRNYMNLRAGAVAAHTSSGRRPNICLEASPIAPLALETCGTGNGFLHEDPEPEMAHFRGHWRLADWRWNDAWIHPRIGAGFAEIQMGADESGFHFTSAPNGVETAGPEALASVQMVYGIPAGFEMIAELHAGAAYFEHAAKLSTPMAKTQPFGGFTVGVGW
jgi:hypothetical protein